MLWLAAVMFACFVPGSPQFETASVKPSRSAVNGDGSVTVTPGALIAHNMALKALIFEAWQVPYLQIEGDLEWLNNDQFDIEARTDSAATSDRLRLMLRQLLTDRFGLAIELSEKEGRVYALVVGKGGAKLPQSKRTDRVHEWQFHGSLLEFANVLAIKLTIPFSDSPAIPSFATGEAIPVVNKTSLEGVYDIQLDIKPDSGSDTFTIWQRALKEQLGLRLDAGRGRVVYLNVKHAERPVGN